MKGNFTLFNILCFMLLTSWSYGQLEVSGTITDVSGEPLIGASVTEKNTTNGTVTDFDGAYELEVSEDATLVFSYIGFSDKEIEVNGRQTIDVELKEGEDLSEVVVTALGMSREKKALGYAVDQIESDVVQNSVTSNPLTALQGRSAGVNITNTSGAVGAGANIQIRGIASLNPGRSNRPLFVIDGIEISDDVNVGVNVPGGANYGLGSGSQTQTSTSNRLMDINPDDIASMTVLKGAAATALYGVRAASGAIIITTKKGKSGEPTIDLSYSRGWSQVNKFPQVQTQFIDGHRSTSLKRSFLWDSWGAEVVDQTISEPRNVYEEFYQTGTSNQVSASVAAGTDKFNYRLSGGYLDQQGVVPESYFKKANLGLNVEYNMTDKLTVGGNFLYSNSKANTPHEGRKSIINVLNYMAVVVDPTTYTTPYTYGGNFAVGIIDHPQFLAENVTNLSNVDRIIGQLSAEYDFTNNLTLRYKFGLDNYTDARERTVHPETDEGQSGVNGPPYGFLVANNIGGTSVTSNLSLNYNTDLSDDFSLNATLGQYVYTRDRSNLAIIGRQFELDGFFNLDNTKDLGQFNSVSQYRNTAIFGEVVLGFRDYLYLTLTGRNDYTSTLPEGNNSYFFPSANVALVVSDMVEVPEPLSFLKLRASYAIVGNDADPYDVGRYYGLSGGFPFGETIGYSASSAIGDLNLQPEFTNTLEVGMDARFLKNRFGVDLSYYTSQLDNMILSVPISNSTGAARYLTNAGSISNWGFEGNFYADILKSDENGLNWTLGVNYGMNRGTVEEISTGSDESEIVLASVRNVTYKYVEEGRIGDLYGAPFNRTENGDLILDDEGLPTLNQDTSVLMGNALPDFIMGITNDLSYRGFSLSFLFEWKVGGKAIDVGRAYMLDNGQNEETLGRYQKVVFDGVTLNDEGEYVENTQEAEITPAGFYRNSNRHRYAPEAFLKDTDWFRLRNISLSYSLPLNNLNIDWASEIRFSLVGNNVFLSTPYRGFDPESNYFGPGSNIRGFTGMRTPNTKSYELKVNLTF